MARATIDYLTELGQARMHSEVIARRNNPNQCVVDPELGHWLARTAGNTDGYVQVS